MTLKELRIWHRQQQQKNEANGSKNLPQAAFHFTAVSAITEAIGGSVEQDIADAKALANLIPPDSVLNVINKEYRTHLPGEWGKKGDTLERPLMRCPLHQCGEYPAWRKCPADCKDNPNVIDPSDMAC